MSEANLETVNSALGVTVRKLQADLAAADRESARLREAIERAIRQHEEGNKGLAHRTLCEAVYGVQA